jgi:hydrogenase expression/formation protein HypE
MEDKISLAHGSGCKATRELIEKIIIKYLGNPILDKLSDASLLEINNKKIYFTTDSYTINPIFFSGGDIGKLAISGTTNDLAMMGAKPLFLSLSFIIEEGFTLNDLERIVKSIRDEKKKIGVEIVCGDIKVIEKGKLDKIIINTAGIGILEYRSELSVDKIKAGDKIILNGEIGEHEIAILLARGEFNFKANIKSDCCLLWPSIKELLSGCSKIKFMRDPTRGGLGVVLNEIVENENFGIVINEEKIPISEGVKTVCEILGYDPLYLANEGKFIMVINDKEVEKAISIMKNNKWGRKASIIGEITDKHKGKVVLNTLIGGKRIIDMPYGTQLPRIC